MSDSGDNSSPTLASLGATRPRPRRNHKPSTPRLLSPSYDSLPSLFDDDQLAAFFPSVSTADTDVPDTPSSAPSILKSNHSDTIYRYPSVAEETEEVHDEGLTAPADGAEETREKKRMKMEEGGGETEARRENEKGGNEEERVGDNGGRREDENNGEGDKEEGGGDRARKEEKGRVSWTKNEEGERNEETRREKEVKEEECKSRRKDKEGVVMYHSTDDEVFNDVDDTAGEDAPTDREIPAKAPPDSPFSFSLASYPDQTAEAPQRIPWGRPTCSTPDSIPNSTYTTDDAAPTEILSSPQSAAYEDEDVPNIFVFPPKISRLGSIYSSLGISNSGGDSSSSDSEGEARGTLPKKVSLDTESQKKCGKGDVQKRARSAEFDRRKDGANWTVLNEPRKSHFSGRSSLGSLSESVSQSVPWIQNTPEAHDECRSHAAEDEAESEVSIVLRRKTVHKGGKTNDERDGNRIARHSSKPAADLHCSLVKKVPPPKPPRHSASARPKNNDNKRMSREDPVRYDEVSCKGELAGKRSCSMDNILESNLEATDKRCSQPTRNPAREVTGLLQTPEAQGEKKERRTRGSFKYKEAAKIVSSIISKKPPFAPLLHRRDAGRHKGPSSTSKKVACKDVELSPPPSPAAVEEKKQEDVVTPPNKPARSAPVNDMSVPGSGSLDKAQTTCSAHGALLHFYCVKCRVVVCRDCTVVAHTHDENHRVLDTLDSLAMLRSEAVEMLRHYTILESMHAALSDIYRKFRTQHRDIDITAIKKRLDEGKYLSEVVKEAECMVTAKTNLQKIRECVSQWEARQDEWGDLVFLASRCALLTDMNIPSDTVFLRMGSWVMPTPWIQLSHLLQPYLRASTAPQTPQSSSNAKDKQHTPSSHRKAIDMPSPIMRRSASPYGGKSSTGGTDQPFPYNARQIVLSNLIPYIILNPDIRYFVHVRGPRDVDLTLVVVPVDDHAKDCLRRRRNNATKSPGELRQANNCPPNDAITLVEQQMTAGACKTRITASSMPPGPSSAPAIVKVSFSDVKIVSDGQGLPRATGGVKRGDVVVDQTPSGQPTLTVMLRDIADFSALRLGQITWGMDGLTCLISTEDAKRTESSGFRAKIRATVKREEEAVYDVMFGMDL